MNDLNTSIDSDETRKFIAYLEDETTTEDHLAMLAIASITASQGYEHELFTEFFEEEQSYEWFERWDETFGNYTQTQFIFLAKAIAAVL